MERVDVGSKSGAGGVKHRLLIVDDEPLVLAELREALRTARIEIAEAGNGLEALAYVERWGMPDIVLTDICMPGLDGLSMVSRMVETQSSECQCAVIFASGRGTVSDVATALRLNAVDFIEKPMGRLQVRAAIDSARKKLTLRQKAIDRQLSLTSEIMSIRDRADALMGSLGDDLLSGAKPGFVKNIKKFPATSGQTTQIYLDQIEAIKKNNCEKRNILGDLADDGVIWSMLVDLLSAHLRGLNVTVTSLCCVTNAPQTTSLRKIEQIESLGLVERRADADDRRRRIVVLSEKGIETVLACLSGASG